MRAPFSDHELNELKARGLSAIEIRELEKVRPLAIALLSKSAPRKKVIRELKQGAKRSPKGQRVRDQHARTGDSMEPYKREVSARTIEAHHREDMDDAYTWKLAYLRAHHQFKRTGQGRQRVSALAIDVLNRALMRGYTKQLARDSNRKYDKRRRRLRASPSLGSDYYEIMRICLGIEYPERHIRAFIDEREKRLKVQRDRMDNPEKQ